ncbi:MAG: hypothetical protein AB1521_16435 [Bacteroidota bacterium]
MNFRYLSGIVVGVITIAAILLFGEKGVIALALLALRPLIMRWKKMKADERELSLFHKTNSVTLGIVLLLIVISILIYGPEVKEYFTTYWLTLLAGTVVGIQGIVGFVLLKFK